jgi:plastocyanin
MRHSVLPFVVTTALAAVHTVEVGEDGLVFNPQTVTADPGDMVVFKFYPSHNVVQGSFSSPCQSSDSGCRWSESRS